MKTVYRVLLLAAAIAFVPLTADALLVDLTNSSSGSINGAIFTIDDLQPAGSGVIDPFLTIQRKGFEQGYNGTNGNFDTKRIPQFNHEITLGSLAVFTLNGTAYYQFLVDVNEPNSGTKPLISLDALRVYTSATIQSSTSTDSSGRFSGSLGDLRYDLGAGNWVLYDDQHHGSGQADISIYIPVANFALAGPSDFVYMYQAWGYGTARTEGGFEETTALLRQVTVPEPATSLLLGAGLLIGAGTRYLRRGPPS